MSSSSDKLFYDNTSFFNEQMMLEVAVTCQTYFRKYRRGLEEAFAGRDRISVLELGAGTCCLSLLLSSLPFVKEIYCSDVSIKKMQCLLPLSSKHIAGHPGKLTLVEGDFGERFEFGDNAFDLVAFDAALHHSRSIWLTLSECRRVLKPNGLLVCQREAYLGLLSFRRKLRELLSSDEVRNGVSENAYLKEQYRYYLKASGFDDVRFMPVAENVVQKLLLPLNGLIYSKWVMLAHKASNSLTSA